jgi:hypothetical protein
MSLQEFKFCGYYSDKAEDTRFKYELVDSDFVVEGITTGPRYTAPIGFGPAAIVEVYRERNLNVEGNVAIFLLQFAGGRYNISYLIEKCRAFPQWKYINEDRLKKYIVFS